MSVLRRNSTWHGNGRMPETCRASDVEFEACIAAQDNSCRFISRHWNFFLFKLSKYKYNFVKFERGYSGYVSRAVKTHTFFFEILHFKCHGKMQKNCGRVCAENVPYVPLLNVLFKNILPRSQLKTDYRIRAVKTPGFYFSKWVFGWGSI